MVLRLWRGAIKVALTVGDMVVLESFREMGFALLDKPAVAPNIEWVNTVEDYYN